MITPGIDHIALTVPDLDEQVDRLTSAFGMAVESRFEGFALVADPSSGLKIELSRSDDSHVHFRHLGFRAEDVDGAHESLVEAGMASRPPGCLRNDVYMRAKSRPRRGHLPARAGPRPGWIRRRCLIVFARR